MTNGSNLNGLPLILSQLNQVDRKLEPRGHTLLFCKKLVFKIQLPIYTCVCFQTLKFIIHVVLINNVENLDMSIEEVVN